jgi:PAS domain S-box-containing protein
MMDVNPLSEGHQPPDAIGALDRRIRTHLTAMFQVIEHLNATDLTAEQAREMDTLRGAVGALMEPVRDLVSIAARREAGSERKTRVLIVDDNASFLRSAVRLLGTHPDVLVVGVASSGEEAVEHVDRLLPDVVLMDVAMPGIGGVEATRQVKARLDAPRVLLVSLYDTAELRALVRAAGADGYVGKWEFSTAAFAAIRAAVPAERLRRRDLRTDRLRSLACLNHLISSTLDMDEVLRAIACAGAELMGAPVVSFWLADEATRTLTVRAWSDSAKGADCPIHRIGYGEGGVGWVAVRRRRLHLPDIAAASDPGSRPRYIALEWAQRHGLSSFLGMPVLLDGQLLAVVALSGPEPFVLDSESEELLDALVAQAAAAIRNARLHEETRRGRDFLRSIAEHSADAIIVTDPDGTVVYVNPRVETMFGYRAAELLGTDIRALAARWARTPEDAAPIARHLSRGEAIHHYESSVTHRDGHLVDITASIAPLPDPDGTRAGSVAVVRDVTELRQTQRVLQEAERLSAIGSLLAGVAHELNNPLQVVAGQAEMLLPEVAEQPLVGRRVEQIHQAATRCVRIVRNFLALARRRPRALDTIDLNEVVMEALELLAYQLRVDDVEVEHDLATDLPEILGDRHELHQILVNLVDNARQAMRTVPGPHRLRLTTRHEPAAARVVLEVADSGSGVPDAIRDRIFEPLFTTKPAGEGTGLGLSLCHSIARAHGGRIRLEPRGAEGAVFVVELPVGAITAPQADADAEPVASPGGLPSLRVLVVDDEPDVAAMIVDMLHGDGHDVVVEMTGQQALERVGVETFDVVLADVRMPEMGGVEFLQVLAVRAPALARHVVVMTGDALTPETTRLMDSADLVTLEKPFRLDQLRAALARAFRSAEP